MSGKDYRCSSCLKNSQESIELPEHKHMCHTCCSDRSTFWRRHLYLHLYHMGMHRKSRTMSLLNIWNQNVFILCLFLILTLCSQSTAQAQAGDGTQSWNQSWDSVGRSGEDSGDKNKCKMNVTKCELIPNGTTCFGAKLPYSYTSTFLATDSQTLEEVQRKLHLWQGNGYSSTASSYSINGMTF